MYIGGVCDEGVLVFLFQFWRESQRVNHCLPTTLGILLILGQLIKVDTNHGFTQIFRDFSQDLGILKVGNSLDCKKKGWEKLKPNLSIYQHNLPMAFARLAGSPDLKIPEPTKTPSQPSCYIKPRVTRSAFFFKQVPNAVMYA